jgi:hypothetical protein
MQTLATEPDVCGKRGVIDFERFEEVALEHRARVRRQRAALDDLGFDAIPLSRSIPVLSAESGRVVSARLRAGASRGACRPGF